MKTWARAASSTLMGKIRNNEPRAVQKTDYRISSRGIEGNTRRGLTSVFSGSSLSASIAKIPSKADDNHLGRPYRHHLPHLDTSTATCMAETTSSIGKTSSKADDHLGRPYHYNHHHLHHIDTSTTTCMAETTFSIGRSFRHCSLSGAPRPPSAAFRRPRQHMKDFVQLYSTRFTHLLTTTF